MRIVIHTQYYPPEMGAPQARLSDLARRCRQVGHEVRVLTALPNYPGGRIFDGYPRYYLKEIIDGIAVHRTWILPSKSRNLIRRFVAYLSFSFSSALAGLMVTRRADIILTESPPLFLAVSGLFLAKAAGARWILNVSDLWPESATSIGLMSVDSRGYKLMRALARFCYRRAWLVTGQSAEIVSAIALQAPNARTYHLSNGVDCERFHPGLRSVDVRARYLRPGEIGVVYAGLHGLFQGLDGVMEAAARLRRKPIRFLFLGEGPLKSDLTREATAGSLDNVTFCDPLPPDEVAAVLASMDVALVPLKSAIFGAVPSKMYEAMASGLAVLLVADGEARKILEAAGAGMAVSPGNSRALAETMEFLASDPELRRRLGEAGRRTAVALFDRREIVRVFLSKLEELMSGKGHPRSMAPGAGLG